jgi:prevent-host-death family protein
MVIVNTHEAKTHFSRLLRRAAAGEEVVIANAGEPVARLVRYETPSEPRIPGSLAGQITIHDGFDELPPGFAEVFLPE